MWQGEGEPSGPEAGGSRDDGQINVPDVIRIFGRNNMVRLFDKNFLFSRWFGLYWFFDETADGGGADLQAGNSKAMGDALLAHERAEDF